MWRIALKMLMGDTSNRHRRPISRRRAERLALGSLKLLLAGIFVGFGLELLYVPRLVVSPHFGPGPRSWLLLGAAHVAMGIALLAHSRRGGLTVLSGPLIIWCTVSTLPRDETFTAVVPSVLTLALIVLTVGWRHSRRADAVEWHSILDRYVREQESIHSG